MIGIFVSLKANVGKTIYAAIVVIVVVVFVALTLIFLIVISVHYSFG